MLSVMNFVRFIQSAFVELRHVDWAKKDDVYRYTAVVFIMLIVFVIFFFVLDVSISKILGLLLSAD